MLSQQLRSIYVEFVKFEFSNCKQSVIIYGILWPELKEIKLTIDDYFKIFPDKLNIRNFMFIEKGAMLKIRILCYEKKIIVTKIKIITRTIDESINIMRLGYGYIQTSTPKNIISKINDLKNSVGFYEIEEKLASMLPKRIRLWGRCFLFNLDAMITVDKGCMSSCEKIANLFRYAENERARLHLIIQAPTKKGSFYTHGLYNSKEMPMKNTHDVPRNQIFEEQINLVLQRLKKYKWGYQILPAFVYTISPRSLRLGEEWGEPWLIRKVAKLGRASIHVNKEIGERVSRTMALRLSPGSSCVAVDILCNTDEKPLTIGQLFELARSRADFLPHIGSHSRFFDSNRLEHISQCPYQDADPLVN